MADLLARLNAGLGDRYRIERELGGGGMSHVFVAEEAGLGRRVVIKVLPPEASEAVSADRFTREIQVAASLQHPHIVPLHAAGEVDGLLWYSMPFVEGESLAARLARTGPLPPSEAMRIVRDVADALAAAHARGIVHRDIKPANILISGRHAVVADFGVAKAVTASTESTGRLTAFGIALGTPAYMAPEQAAADPRADHRADIYALGVVAYEMLTGRLPYDADTPQAMLAAHIATAPTPILSARRDLPPDLAEAVMRCLAKNPADRWSRADDLVEFLEGGGAASSGGRGAAPNALQAQRILHTWSKRRVASLFTATAAVVVAVAFGFSRVAGFPDWIWWIAAGLMVIGLPVVWLAAREERRRARATLTGTHLTPTGSMPWRSGRSAMRGGVAAIGVLVLLAGGWLSSRALGIGPAATLRSAGRLKAEDRLLLADFDNRTGDSTLGPAVVEALRVDLGQSRSVRLLEPAEVLAAVRRTGANPDSTPVTGALAREVALREGAKAVVAGEIAPLGSGYVLTARVISADSGVTLVPVRETATSSGDLIAAVNRLSAQLREHIGESLKSIRSSEALEQVTTASLPALRLYTEALRLDAAGRDDAALAELEQAVATDSAFAMAWRKIAVLRGNLGRDRAATLDAATRAFRHRDRLPVIERSLTEANYHERVEADVDQAINSYRAVLAIDPDNYIALNNLGLLLRQVGRFAESEQPLRRAVEQTRPNWVAWENLENTLQAQGKLAAADSVGPVYLKRFGDTTRALMLQVEGTTDKRDFSRTDTLVPRLRKIMDQSPAMLDFVDLHERVADETRGKLRSAERILDDQVRRAVAGGDRGGALSLRLRRASYAGFQRDDAGAVLPMVEQALAEMPLDSIAPASRPYFDLAWAYALAGRPDLVLQARRGWEAATPVATRPPGTADQWDAFAAIAAGKWSAVASSLARAGAAARCGPCYDRIRGYAVDRAGMTDSAIALYTSGVSLPNFNTSEDDPLFYPLALFRLGELHADRGDRDPAIDYLQRFVSLWQSADPELQPRVKQARQRLAELTAEGKRP